MILNRGYKNGVLKKIMSCLYILLLKKQGPEHEPKFTISVTHGSKLNAVGIGKNKQEAEKNAASKLLKEIEKKNFKCGFILLSGFPNAGKSLLLNNLIKKKVSIVSPKIHTTRDVISGILNIGDTQLIFSDTPGIGIVDEKKIIIRNYLDRFQLLNLSWIVIYLFLM